MENFRNIIALDVLNVIEHILDCYQENGQNVQFPFTVTKTDTGLEYEVPADTSASFEHLVDLVDALFTESDKAKYLEFYASEEAFGMVDFDGDNLQLACDYLNETFLLIDKILNLKEISYLQRYAKHI